MEVLRNLLLLPPYLQLEGWQISPPTTQVRLTIVSMGASANCPICHSPTVRVHSHYERTLTDLPWGQYRVIWQLQVRKFFCTNTACPRRIFTERLPGMVLPWARKTSRLREQLSAIGLFLGGATGARLGSRLGLTISRHTLLRLVRQVTLPELATPTILGVDDWAYCKRKTYGTILVDLETHQPVALLPDREAETLAKWLKNHPGVEVISRDRARAYEKGAKAGAPQGIQVADRFHLLQNLAEALEAVLSDHSSALKAVAEAIAQASVSRPDGSVAVPVPPPPSPNEAVVLAKQRRARRLNIYQQVQTLRERGWSAPAIARLLGIGKSTVFRYLRTAQFPERKGRSDRGRSLLDPYKHYLLKRWNSGCREVKQLFCEIKKKGYRGSYCTVTRYAQRLRSSQGLAPRQRLSSCPLPEVIEPKKKPLTVRRATPVSAAPTVQSR
nr:ISL3 family transposase [Cylindrospermum stagnale]